MGMQNGSTINESKDSIVPIKTVIDLNQNVTQKTYYVDIQLYNIESTEVVWTTENSEIVKIINKKKLKF